MRGPNSNMYSSVDFFNLLCFFKAKGENAFLNKFSAFELVDLVYLEVDIIT